MRALALVSGGKDSCYAMMLAKAHGHELVGLATLTPHHASPAADDRPDVSSPSPADGAPPAGDASLAALELDSQCFQTIGTTHARHIARSMGLPHFDAPTHARAACTALDYEPAAGDEVEELLRLVEAARAAASFDAVVSGAILSNYQRTRVESVCERLGLTSLAPLWRRPQHELLSEMVSAGLDAVVVKVASLGLERCHVGRSVGELAPHFEELAARFGFHECGEGGEYETLTRNCPLFVGGALELLEPAVRVHSASWPVVAILSVPRVRLGAPPADGAAALSAWCERQRAHRQAALAREAAVAEAGEEEAVAAARAAAALAAARLGSGGALVAATGDDGAVERVPPPPAPPGWTGASGGSSSAGGHMHLVFGADAAAAATAGAAAAPAEELACMQLRGALTALPASLEARGASLGRVLLVRVHVRDMGHYAALNRVYAESMAAAVAAPAARVCVGLPLAAGVHVSLEVLAAAGRAPKRHLRVQSISEWAPRMIGPYCQLTAHGGIARTAGNLGFDSATMELVSGGVRAECRAALAHCAAVLRAEGFAPRAATRLLVCHVGATNARAVGACVAGWLARQRDCAANDAPEPPLPHVLHVEVASLPKAGLAEVAMEAVDEAVARVVACEPFRVVCSGCELECHAHAVVRRRGDARGVDGDDDDDDESPGGSVVAAQCVARNRRPDGPLDAEQVARAARCALRELEVRGGRGAGTAAAALVRCVYTAGAVFGAAGALERALSAALPAACVALVPALSLSAGSCGACDDGARAELVLQLSFDAT